VVAPRIVARDDVLWVQPLPTQPGMGMQAVYPFQKACEGNFVHLTNGKRANMFAGECVNSWSELRKPSLPNAGKDRIGVFEIVAFEIDLSDLFGLPCERIQKVFPFWLAQDLAAFLITRGPFAWFGYGR